MKINNNKIMSFLLLTLPCFYAEADLKKDLDLKLVGTIVHSEQKDSVASISEKAYKPNETIDKKAQLLSIHRFFVELKDLATKKVEVLKVEPFDSKMAVPPKDLFEQGRSTFQVPRSDIEWCVSNLLICVNDAGTAPAVDKDGKIVGFKITYIKAGSVLAKLGLKVGDVLTHVNETRIDSVAVVLELFNQLRDSSMIELGVLREKRQKRFTYLVR